MNLMRRLPSQRLVVVFPSPPIPPWWCPNTCVPANRFIELACREPPNYRAIGAWKETSASVQSARDPARWPEAQRIAHKHHDQGHGRPERHAGFFAVGHLRNAQHAMRCRMLATRIATITVPSLIVTIHPGRWRCSGSPRSTKDSTASSSSDATIQSQSGPVFIPCDHTRGGVGAGRANLSTERAGESGMPQVTGIQPVREKTACRASSENTHFPAEKQCFRTQSYTRAE
jgi:hypothetical protein